MADTGSAPAQYKQSSRKGKKAWRKNVDVTQIQSGLDEVRDQIIHGYVLRLLQPLYFADNLQWRGRGKDLR